MKRLASGLAAIRVMGKVEAGRLSTGALNDPIADLEALQGKLNLGLPDIFALSNALLTNSGQLLGLYAG